MAGKRTKETLQAQTDLLAIVFENSPNILILVDSEGRIEKINRAGSEFAGSPQEELIGLLSGEVFRCINSFDGLGCGHNPVCVDCPVRMRMTQSLEEGVTILNEEGRLTVRKDAGEIPMDFLISTAPVKVANEVKVLVTIVDITERKLVDEALRRSESQYRTILRTMLDGFWLVDSESGRILDVNDAYCQMSGYTRDEILQMVVADFDAFESSEDVQEHNKKVLSLGEDRFESVHRRKDGSLFEVEISVKSLRSDGVRKFAFIHDVTARKQAEQALRKSEEQYRLLFNEMLSGFALHEIICDENGIPVDYRFLAVNNAFENLTGLKADDLLGKTVLEVMPETEAYWIERYGRVALEGATDQFDGFSSSMGKYYEARAFCPEPGKFAVMFHDVTERMQAENELRKSEENLEITLQSIGDAVIAADLNGRVIRMNPAAEKLTGWEFEEAKDKKLSEVFRIANVNTRKKVADPVKKVLESGKVVGLANHTVLLSRDGQEYQIADSAAPIRDKGGRLQGVILTFSDVTEKYMAEEALRRSEENLNKAQHFARVGSWTWNIKTNHLEWSDEMFSIFGIDKQTFAGSLSEVISTSIHPDDRPKVEESNQSVAHEGKPIPVEYRVIRPDGSVRTVWGQAGELVKDELGKPAILSGIVQDVTERKQAEDDLRIALTKYKTLFNTIPLGITVSDETGNILESNAVAEKILGLSKSEQAKRSIGGAEWNIIRPDGTPMPASEFASVRALKEKQLVENVETGLVKSKEETSWISVTAALLPLDGYGVVIAYSDITERKQIEEKLKVLLQEKEILLAEVHHRVKNNLQIIVSLLGLQAREIGDERVRVAFEESRNRINSMALVHEQLYRAREYAKIEFKGYVGQLAATLFSMYQVEPERVRFEVDAKDVYLNLESAIPCGLLLNELITNSLKYAFPDGRVGKIWIKLVPEEDKMVLIVGDDGIGIPAKFDLETSQSLGLQLVNLLTVHDLQGKIRLEREKGTRFHIEFPVQLRKES